MKMMVLRILTDHNPPPSLSDFIDGKSAEQSTHSNTKVFL